MSQVRAKILIVDDTSTNVQILNAALQNEFKTYLAAGNYSDLHRNKPHIRYCLEHLKNSTD